ncbi:MAG: anthranilate phosphoribosyltransferase [Candidatus Gastranaerophilales bacterium]|nr:anthranilate phosphoribosyltransferase [Candidatus Gastranaerophilales bacterium]
MISELLKKLVRNENLSSVQIKYALNEILNGAVSPVQTAAFLTALRMKGETIDEITAAVELLREKGIKVPLETKNAIDIVGTGGDGANSFNISTAAAFVISAGGVKVAKHGNRSFSSKSGAADVLEALGANIMTDASQNKEIFEKTGICFMFAPNYSPLLKNAANVRKELKIRTVFNLLGPLINPSNVSMQLIGVYDKNLVKPIAQVMSNLKINNGFTVFGECGLDEASVISKTYWARIKNNKITTGEFIPEDFGIKRAKIEDIKGDSPTQNAKIMLDIFQNKIKGAKKDVVALNAALAFLISEKANSIAEGIKYAYNLIDSGAVYEKLDLFIRASNEYIK